MRESNVSADDVAEQVESLLNVNQRDFDDAKGIVRPRDREVQRSLDRIGLTQSKVEAFFGQKISATFTDGSDLSRNHQTEDLEIPHNLGQVPSDVIQGMGQKTTAESGGGQGVLTLWRGNRAWTTEYIYLRCTIKATVNFYLVVD